MAISYKKPELKTYSVSDIIQEIGPCQSQYTTTLYTAPGSSGYNIDGFVSSDGTFIDTTNDAIAVGETAIAGVMQRSFVGFDLSTIPAGSTIMSATLRVYQFNIDNSPYANLGGAIRVDVVDFGTSLDSTDYSSTALASNIGNISTNPTLEWKTMDVTSQAHSRVSARYIQFRLYFPGSAAPPTQDLAAFVSADHTSSDSSDAPQLAVTYR